MAARLQGASRRQQTRGGKGQVVQAKLADRLFEQALEVGAGGPARAAFAGVGGGLSDIRPVIRSPSVA
ncbi:MAG TPA: hypothetical protein VFE10_03225 [Phenylobacterium sp.]|nr:hypothetical protein [Phenylobacterium sp.]